MKTKLILAVYQYFLRRVLFLTRDCNFSMKWLTFPLILEFVNSWTIRCLFLHLYFMSFVLEEKKKGKKLLDLLSCNKGKKILKSLSGTDKSLVKNGHFPLFRWEFYFHLLFLSLVCQAQSVLFTSTSEQQAPLRQIIFLVTGFLRSCNLENCFLPSAAF